MMTAATRISSLDRVRNQGHCFWIDSKRNLNTPVAYIYLRSTSNRCYPLFLSPLNIFCSLVFSLVCLPSWVRGVLGLRQLHLRLGEFALFHPLFRAVLTIPTGYALTPICHPRPHWPSAPGSHAFPSFPPLCTCVAIC